MKHKKLKQHRLVVVGAALSLVIFIYLSGYTLVLLLHYYR